MKRAGNLYDAICEPENLRFAYINARRAKMGRPDVLAFSNNLVANLENLRHALVNETVELGKYRYFTVHDPKKRTICAAAFGERVIHHAVMNVCDPMFERYQIFDSYASRRCKGTFAALERAERFTEQSPWFLKLDIKKYFDSIDHNILKEMLGRLFKDARLLHLLKRIIESYEKNPGKGVPIGNLTSQYFANHYLAAADHFIKEKLHTKRYVRYMDDMALWNADKETLLDQSHLLEQFLSERLALLLKPICLNRSEMGMPFLGFRVFPDKTLLRPGSRHRFRCKIKRIHEKIIAGAISQEDYGSRSHALVAHIAHANTRGFRRAVLKEFGHRQGVPTV
jgi:hypothetical protein